MKKILLIIIFLFCSIYIVAEDVVSVSGETANDSTTSQVVTSTDTVNISTNTSQVNISTDTINVSTDTPQVTVSTDTVNVSSNTQTIDITKPLTYKEVKENVSKLGVKDSSSRIYEVLKEMILDDKKFF